MRSSVCARAALTRRLRAATLSQPRERVDFTPSVRYSGPVSAVPCNLSPVTCCCVRDARPEGRDGAATGLCGGGGPAPLGTVVSCPTARAARPGAQRRDTPKPAVPSSLQLKRPPPVRGGL